MIIRYSVGNFRSIRDRVELTMEEASLKDVEGNSFTFRKKQLLKSAAIYGANASGKSNLLKSIGELRNLVVRSASLRLDQSIPAYDAFKIRLDDSEVPVTVEIDFTHNDQIFSFSVAFTSTRVISEELHHYPNLSKALLYSRRESEPMKFGDSFKGSKKTIESLLLPNQLFLSKAAENKAESVEDAFLFFSKYLLVFPVIVEPHSHSLSKLFARRLAENRDSSFARRFNKLICSLDVGISKIKVEEVDWSQIQLPNHLPDEIRREVESNFRYDIRTEHPVYQGGKRVGTASFDLADESAGTRGLFVVGGIVLDVLENGSTLVVDEFEKNLHPMVTKYLVKLFHSDLTNPKRAQLIFATHDIILLSTDSFRRDQIWFTEKDECGVTSLFRCSDIKGIRKGTPLDKWYATGRLGATPIINDVDFLIDMEQEHEEGV